MTNKQFDAMVRRFAQMEEFEMTEHLKNRLKETIANPAAGKKIRRFSMRTVLITVLAILLLSAAAYAAATNPTIIEIYTSWFGKDSQAVQNLSGQTVQAPDLRYELNDITIVMTQAIFDGNTLYTTGTVSKKESSNVIIMADDYSPKDPANADFHRVREDLSNAPTYRDLAAERGAKLLHTYVWVEFEGGDGCYMIDTIPLEDGGYSFVTEFPDAKVTGDIVKGTIGALQYEVTDDGVEIPGTRVRKEWEISMPAIAKEIRTPVPTPVITPVPASVQDQALIVIGDTKDSKTAQAYQAAHPGSHVIYQNVYDENGMVRLGPILSGSDDWDVLMGFTGLFDLRMLMDGGYLKDLSGYEKLQEYVSAMHPAIRNALSSGGKLYAVPLSMYNRQYACGSQSLDVDIWTASGYTQEDIPQTMEELCDFIDQWLDRPAEERKNGIISMAAEGSYHSWLLDMLLDKYIDFYEYTNTPLNFDTELFARLLTRIRQVSARLDKDKDEKTGPGKWLLFDEYMSPVDSAARIAPLRLSDDSPYLAPAYLTVYIVNPNSRHLEQAIQYLECVNITEDEYRAMMLEGIRQEDLPNTRYEEDLALNESSIATYQSRVESATTEDDRIKATERLQMLLSRREKLQGKLYAVEADALETYQKSIAPNLYFTKMKFYFEKSETWASMDTAKKNYLAGKLNAEEFIRKLNELTQMAKAN